MAPSSSMLNLIERPKKQATGPPRSAPFVNNQLTLAIRQVPARVKNPDGTIPSTECYDQSKLPRAPYHHVLACGHQIVTASRQPCATNCMQTGALQILGDEFKCPAKDCAALRRREAKKPKLFMPKKGVVHEAKNFRTCWSSKAVGSAPEEIAMRANEVTSAKKKAGVIARTNAAKRLPQKQVAGKKRNAEDAEMEDAEELEAKRTLVIQMAKKHTIKYTKELTQLKADSDYVKEIPHTHQLSEDTEWQKRVQANTTSNWRYLGFSYKDRTVDELLRPKKGVGIPRVERDVMLDLTDDVDEPEGQTWIVNKLHCLCKSQDRGYMVECAHCAKFFHPSCIGKGTADLEAYEDEKRFKSLTDDLLYYQEHGFSCSECDGTSDKPLKVLGFQEHVKEMKRAKKTFKPIEVNGFQQKIEFVCNGCEDRYVGLCHNCKVCGEFRLCLGCLKKPETTYQHQHDAEDVGCGMDLS